MDEPTLIRRRVRTILGHQRRRARDAGARIDFGPEALRALVADAVGRPCRHCGVTLTARAFGIDHAQPTSRGGGWGLDNLRVVCMRCNEAKGALSEEEFTALLALLATWPDEARRGTLARLRAGGRAGR